MLDEQYRAGYDKSVPLPDLTPDGLLPPGLHKGTVQEIVNRFCSATETRRALEAPLRELVDAARSVGAVALYLNGSFVSEKPDPGDIDAVLVVPVSFDTASPDAQRIKRLHQLYGFDIERVRDNEKDTLKYLLTDFFGHDRSKRPRGLIEVLL